MLNIADADRITRHDLHFEGRISRMEAACGQLVKEIDEVKADLRWIIGIMVTGFGGLFVMVAHGFGWF